MAGAQVNELIAEFVGTFLLVFTVGCNVLSKTPVWTGVSIACVLMVAIYGLGAISGANFNPAVSFALLVTNSMGGPGGMNGAKFAAYAGTQLLAGIVAAFSYAILFWNAFTLGPTKGFGWVQAGMCELLYTFMLCFVVLNVAVARKYDAKQGGQGNQFYGLAIGFVIVAGAYGAGAVSGGCFNPAVAVGIDSSSQGFGIWWCLSYTCFELVGAALAAVAFKLVRPADFARAGQIGQTTTMQSKLIAEFLGTYILVLTVGLNVLATSPAGAFSIAASLMCMIYALGDISGANFNPAVSVAIFLAKLQPVEKRATPKELGLYIVVQLLGGICAAWTYTGIYWGHHFPLGPQPGYKWAQVGVAETIFTFVLCYVVLCTAVSDKTASKDMFGLAIGSCVTVGGFAIGSISGGSLNPAVSVGIASTGGHWGQIGNALMYSGFEFLGAGIAAGIAKTTHLGKD